MIIITSAIDIKREPDKNPARIYYPISYEKPKTKVA